MKKTKGFTLIELVLIIGIIAIIGGFTAPAALSLYDRQKVIATSDEAFSVLKKAQSYAQYRRNNSPFGVRFLDDDTYVLFQGETYDDRDSDYDEVYQLSGLSATTSPTIEDTELVFATGTGAASATTTLTLSLQGYSRNIYICESNLIEINGNCDVLKTPDFDGDDDSVDVGTMDEWGSSLGGYHTFAAWVKTSSNDSMFIGGQANSGGNDTAVYWDINRDADANNDPGKVAVGVRDEDNNLSRIATTESVSINNGEWHHVTIVFDAGNETGLIYVDGSSYDWEYYQYHAPADNTADLNENLVLGVINWQGSLSGFFDGRIANVAIYNDVRTAPEILTDYQNGFINLNDENLVSFWPLDGDFEDDKGDNDGSGSGDIDFVEDANRPKPLNY